VKILVLRKLAKYFPPFQGFLPNFYSFSLIVPLPMERFHTPGWKTYQHFPPFLEKLYQIFTRPNLSRRNCLIHIFPRYIFIDQLKLSRARNALPPQHSFFLPLFLSLFYFSRNSPPSCLQTKPKNPPDLNLVPHPFFASTVVWTLFY